jgi:hypothetical protein
MTELVYGRETNEYTHTQFTTDQYICLEFQLTQVAPVTKKKSKKSWNVRRTIFSSTRGTNLHKALLFSDDNHKRRSIHSALCSRDLLPEARNAITCALAILFLPPSPFATPLERTLANGPIFLTDHSQMNNPARETTCRTSWPRRGLLSYILVISVFLSLVLLELLSQIASALEITRRFLQPNGSESETYNNENSQFKPRDFAWKLRGARRISRE